MKRKKCGYSEKEVYEGDHFGQFGMLRSRIGLHGGDSSQEFAVLLLEFLIDISLLVELLVEFRTALLELVDLIGSRL